MPLFHLCGPQASQTKVPMPNLLLTTVFLGSILGLSYYLIRQQRYVLFYLAAFGAFALMFGAGLPDAYRMKKEGVLAEATITRLDCQNHGTVHYAYDAGRAT